VIDREPPVFRALSGFAEIHPALLGRMCAAMYDRPA
jgi:hypothetical protein